jgi:hypothetical protein
MNNRICYIVAIRSARSKPTGLTCHRDARFAVFAIYDLRLTGKNQVDLSCRMYSTVKKRHYIRLTYTTDRYIFGTQCKEYYSRLGRRTEQVLRNGFRGLTHSLVEYKK